MNDMPNFKYEASADPCQVCGLVMQSHKHPPIENGPWWMEYAYTKSDVLTGQVVPLANGVLEKLLAEASRRERDKWLTKLRGCLAQMPVAGNGRRLLIQLIEEMEK